MTPKTLTELLIDSITAKLAAAENARDLPALARLTQELARLQRDIDFASDLCTSGPRFVERYIRSVRRPVRRQLLAA
jgi:hypothetical protein